MPDQNRLMTPSSRHAGLLVPLFSMPSTRSWGIGEILDILELAAWLREADQGLLQLLPINEMAVGQRSPYSAMTAMAIDPIYISVHAVEDFAAIGGEAAMPSGWSADLEAARTSRLIDYERVRRVKDQALRAAFAWFEREEWQRDSSRARALRSWALAQDWWLADYAVFRALHRREEERAWTDWPEPLRHRDPVALSAARRELAHEILYREWLQWIADDQWHAVRRQAAPVSLLGDLPFMVDGDSADVWAHAVQFRFDGSVGAPPDAFSDTGQNWGLPVYRWNVMARRGFSWLRQRAARSAALFDGYRVDHLVGFYRTYVFPHDGRPRHFTPATEPEQRTLGETVLGILAEPGVRIIAEDLGTIPDFVRASLTRLGIPGYKVLRWERHWEQAGQPFRAPEDYPPVSLATTGTHDTETLAAWWDGLTAGERAKAWAIPGLESRLPATAIGSAEYSPGLRDAFLDLLFASGSAFLLLPIQDVFGWRDRINLPASQGDHNWTWRLPWPVDTLARQPEARERAATLRRLSRRWNRSLALEP